MKYNKDCEPFSDETGSHEPIESVGIDYLLQQQQRIDNER